MNPYLKAIIGLAQKHERTAAFCFCVYLGYDLYKHYLTLTLGG